MLDIEAFSLQGFHACTWSLCTAINPTDVNAITYTDIVVDIQSMRDFSLWITACTCAQTLHQNLVYIYNGKMIHTFR